MRRKFIKLMLLLLLLAAAIPFTLPLRDGRPLLSLSALELPTLPQVQLPPGLRGARDATPGPVTVYRWRDSAGIWQYSSTPPAADIPFESRTVDTAANVMPAVTPAPSAATEQKEAAVPDTPSPYSADGMKKLFEDARNLRDHSHQRESTRDKL